MKVFMQKVGFTSLVKNGLKIMLPQERRHFSPHFRFSKALTIMTIQMSMNYVSLISFFFTTE